MGKPRMIILVRHAQSEGNKNRDIHQTIPDHRVKLTSEGHRQAQDAGRRLRDLLHPDDKLHFFTSPYRRTRETTEGILESLTSDTPSPSPFPRHTIKVYEEPRLREQDFGNFQPCSTEMERMWMERADYGHFFYRIPNGESAADAYDRVSGFNESLWRLFGEDDFANVCVLVTHGLMARVFLMKWYHWSVEYFEDLRNINHCEFVVLTHNRDNGKYTLQNKLRTWSDLRKDRERENASKEQISASTASPGQTDHVPIRRKWGGCPDGCTHGITANGKQALRASLLNSMHHAHGHAQPKHHDEHTHNFGSKLHKSVSIDEVVSSSEDSVTQHVPSRKSSTRQVSHPQHSVGDDDTGDNPKHYTSSPETRPRISPLQQKRPALHGLNRNSEDQFIHPPTASSSSSAHLKYALLHLGGRDGGGSMSGANSLAPSDDEGDDHDPHRHTVPTVSSLGNGSLSHANQQHFKFPPHETQRPPPSQEVEDDGDDEMSGNPIEKSNKPRPHHHHHHHHYQHHSSTSQSEHPMANILGDGDESSNPSDTQTQRPEDSTESPSEFLEELSLEEQQQQDQSIRGSVY